MMKMTGNKRQHDNIEKFVRENASIMAKHAEENPNAKRYRSVYKCKDCNKEYNSFQALGGHRAAHKNIKIETGTDSSGLLSLGTPSKLKLHYCKICQKGFPIGQALGGHMRMHWRKTDNVEDDKDELSEEGVDSKLAIVPYINNPPDSSSSSTASASNSKSKEVFEFDLNLTPFENESVNLALQLKV